jgi:hypothetical protein
VTTLHLNFAAAIPVGHAVEITEFSDPKAGKRGPSIDSPQTHPAIQDLDTGIRYLNHVHVSTSGNGGNAFRPNIYPLIPLSSLQVARVSRARVVACTVVWVEGITSQQTVLELSEL